MYYNSLSQSVFNNKTAAATTPKGDDDMTEKPVSVGVASENHQDLSLWVSSLTSRLTEAEREACYLKFQGFIEGVIYARDRQQLAAMQPAGETQAAAR